jgi:predicted Zn-dependent protease
VSRRTTPLGLLPSARERRESDQPVFTREQALVLMKQVLSMTTVQHAQVKIRHTVQSATQLASGRIRDAQDGDVLRINIINKFGQHGAALLQTNQLDESSLRDMVMQADAIVKSIPDNLDKVAVEHWDEQDTYPPATIWHDSTVNAMRTARESTVPLLLDTVQQHQLSASGFVGIMARAEAVLTDAGITAYSAETDSEVSVTARPMDGTSSGWHGVAARDWTTIDPARLASDAAEMAKRSLRPQALEPGRRTAILSPAAVVQLMRFFSLHFNGSKTDDGDTGFSKVPGQKLGTKLHEHMFDSRVQVTTDPRDPEGGFKGWFAQGYVNSPTTWVDKGALSFLGYGTGSLGLGKAYSEMPFGLRLHGGDTTLEQMVAQCDEGIYVNRFSSVDALDMKTGIMTGVTRDGCFLVKDGKIDRPVKNFRFLTSPFFLFNNLIALGPPRRAAFGYAPWTKTEKEFVPSHLREHRDFFDWPRWPMIVPPLMVRDFNFNALIDAV